MCIPRSSQVHTCNKITYDRIGDADINISNNTTQMSELYMHKQTDFTEKKILPYLTIDYLDMSLMKRVRNLAKSKDANHPRIITALYIGFYRMWALRFTRIGCETI